HGWPTRRVTSLGMGHVFVPLSSTALLGVPDHDAGAASALVNTMQQVGASLGIAFLNTIATSATTSYARAHRGLSASAVVHGFTSAFGISVGLLVAAFVVVLWLVRSPDARPRPPRQAEEPYPSLEPAPVAG